MDNFKARIQSGSGFSIKVIPICIAHLMFENSKNTLFLAKT